MTGPRTTTYVRKVEPLAAGWRSFAWSVGVFDTAHRALTETVEGTMRTPHHLVLVTLRGGARRLSVVSECGHRYDGADHAGAVSLVPAHRERRLRLSGVCSAWASIGLSPELLDDLGGGGGREGGRQDLPALTNVEDPFLAGLGREMTWLLDADGALEPSYCEAMSYALGHYLARRYGQPGPGHGPAHRPRPLPPWRLRRIAGYVDAHLDGDIRVADLARVVGLSPGHLHRAFRATTGMTPLSYVNERRVQRAVAILATESVRVGELAPRVGVASPGHVARVVRRVTGRRPSAARDG